MYELNTNCITCKFGGFQITISTQYLKLTHLSDLITRHFSKGGLQLLSDGLVLLLLSSKFILQSVNLFLEFLHRFLCKLSSGLSLLQLSCQRLDLLLVAGLPLVSLLLRHLQRLEVVGYNSQLLLQLNNLHLSSISSLLSPLKLRLNLLEPLLDILILFVGILSLISGIFQFLLQFSHPLFILDCPVLQNLPHSVRIISSSGSLVQLLGGHQQLVLTGLQVAFKGLDSSVKSIDLKFS